MHTRLKKGSGSRGGVITGYTKSGKPIYRDEPDLKSIAYKPRSAIKHVGGGIHHGYKAGDEVDTDVSHECR